MIGRGRKLYWRPSHIPARSLGLLIIAATAALLITETFTRRDQSLPYDKMLTASRTVQEAIETLRPIRADIERINPEVDPIRSGLVGIASSPVTTNSGHLEAKQATINPNWAAVALRLLTEAGVERGDVVAVAVSGSFPALNLAVYSALETLGADPIVIASASASQWGANVPGFLWIDMARHLREAGIIEIKAVAATLGGQQDRGIGMDPAGRESIRRSLERAGIELVVPDSYEAAVAERIRIYREAAGEEPIAALVNVGGGQATTGPASIDDYFDSGLSRSASSEAFRLPSVMGYFLRDGIPVIHFSGIEELASRYGMPYPPNRQVSIGSGGVYAALSYRRWLAGLMIVLLLALTALVMRSANVALAAGSDGRSKDTMKPKV